jgi:hypothetical protein
MKDEGGRMNWCNESNLRLHLMQVQVFDFHELRKDLSLPVTWNSGRQGDATSSLASSPPNTVSGVSELMGWWEGEGDGAGV